MFKNKKLPKKIICPLCNKEYESSRVVFTLVCPTKIMKKFYSAELLARLRSLHGWIDACPWCNDRSYQTTVLEGGDIV